MNRASSSGKGRRRSSRVRTLGAVANALWLTAAAQSTPPAPAQLSAAGALIAARTPYTVVLQESTHGPSADVAQSTMTMALRGDGAFLVQFEHPVGPVLQRTIELPTGVTVVVDDIRHRRTSRSARSGVSFRARMDPARGCVENDAGELVFPGQVAGSSERIAGHDTVRVASAQSTFWFALDLGCATLKSTTRMSDGGTNEKVATRVTPGEPDTALFAVPDSYAEVSPSAFHQMDPTSPEAHEIDAAYFQRRLRR